MVKVWPTGVLVCLLMVQTATAYVNYEYFEGTWDVLPDFDSLVPVHSGLAPDFDITLRDQNDNFGFRFRAKILISVEGDYTFYTASDDGSQLRINGGLVVNNDGLHGWQQRSGQIHLDAGQPILEVTFFEKGGDNELYVLYEGPAIAKQVVPAALLSPLDVPAGQTAGCPFPAMDAVFIDPASPLNWVAPSLVVNPKYNVYFDTDPNFPTGPRVSNSSETVYDPFGADPMASATPYFWRVDVLEAGEGGQETVHPGERWTFTTRSGQIARYEFEVDPNDCTGNGHGGTYKGITDPNIIIDPVRGKVLMLNLHGQSEQQYVEVGAVGISGKTARSITGWARANTTDIPDWTNVFGFAHDGAGTNSYFDIEIDDSARYVLHVYGWQGVFCPADTQWHHFAATFDGALIAWYLDGRFIGNEVRTLSTIDAFRIGSRRSHKTYFPGSVDDITIWDYALTAEDIRQLMLFSNFDRDNDVDSDDLRLFAGQWLDSTVIPNSIKSPIVLDNFESYSATGVPPITMGWFVYLNDNNLNTWTYTLVTGLTETPYGGTKGMRFDFSLPAWTGGDNWLVLAHRLSPRDMKGYDQIRFRVKYHSRNTEDVGLFIHVGDDPPDVTEREAFRIGPFSIVDNVNDPNQWHEITIDLRNNPNIQWQSPYTSVDEIRNLNGILVSVVNSSKVNQTGTLYFDDFRLVDHTPECNGIPTADLTGDCVVDLRDFVFLAEEWLRGV